MASIVASTSTSTKVLNPVVPPAQPAIGYFVDQKKGEINELKQVDQRLFSEYIN